MIQQWLGTNGSWAKTIVCNPFFCTMPKTHCFCIFQRSQSMIAMAVAMAMLQMMTSMTMTKNTAMMAKQMIESVLFLVKYCHSMLLFYFSRIRGVGITKAFLAYPLRLGLKDQPSYDILLCVLSIPIRFTLFLK